MVVKPEVEARFRREKLTVNLFELFELQYVHNTLMHTDEIQELFILYETSELLATH